MNNHTQPQNIVNGKTTQTYHVIFVFKIVTQSSQQRNKKKYKRNKPYLFTQLQNKLLTNTIFKAQLRTIKEPKKIQALQIDQIANARRQGSTELVIGKPPIQFIVSI